MFWVTMSAKCYFDMFVLLVCRGQSLSAGLTSSQPVEKLRALPLWLSLQYLGHDGIVERIKHATQLVSTMAIFGKAVLLHNN